MASRVAALVTVHQRITESSMKGLQLNNPRLHVEAVDLHPAAVAALPPSQP